MDRRRGMDAAGSGALHREWRPARLAVVVVVVQNLLVAACLFATFYVYRSVQAQLREQAPVANVHIRFGTIGGISGNAKLPLRYPESMRMMSVAGDNNDTVHISCTGPYILDVELCYKRLDPGTEERSGVLQLQVEGRGSPASTFHLRASKEVCRGLHNVTYLWAKDRVTLRLYTDELKITQATVGLSYLLGSQCDPRVKKMPGR